MKFLVHFVIYGHWRCFESSQIALAYSSCKIEHFQNIRAHKSRNAFAFIRFQVLINLLNKEIFEGLLLRCWWHLIPLLLQHQVTSN